MIGICKELQGLPVGYEGDGRSLILDVCQQMRPINLSDLFNIIHGLQCALRAHALAYCCHMPYGTDGQYHSNVKTDDIARLQQLLGKGVRDHVA